MKLFAAFIIFMTGIGGAAMARRLSASGVQNFLTLMNTFAGGVFLGAGLLHMLPDSVEKFIEYHSAVDYPTGFAIAGTGFLVILFLDGVLVNEDKALLGKTINGKGGLTGYVLLITLCLHSIITGAAFGIEKQGSMAFAILLAVLAHKGTAAAALMINLEKNKLSKKKQSILITLFSMMTPAGIGIGVLFSALLVSRDEILFEAIFDGLAGGTFIYIATLDIIKDEFQLRDSAILKFISILAGFSVMALVAVWT